MSITASALGQRQEAAPQTGSAREPRDWMAVLASYREAHHGRSLLELAITLGPLMLLWTAMWASLAWSYWITLVLAVPTAGFLVRLFMIQHDCGHGAFFRRRSLNDWLGRVIGVLTLTPYDFWRHSHNEHHAGSGNLDRRGVGDIQTLTTDEYRSRSAGQRVLYRLYRNPVVMFGIGPAYLFLLQQRVPLGGMRDARAWISTQATNAGILVGAGIMIWLVGLGPFLLVQVPIVLIAAAIGVWLFYVQHQFEETWWADKTDWRFHEAALHGSSFYDLPKALHWMTAHIGVHHVHHLCSRIPCYRLPQVLRDNPELKTIGRLSVTESLRCVGLALWDEKERRLISFREMHRKMAAAPG